ncbi:MAG: tetratricopeptide repeat protein [Armatimonadota bacterium]|nr:tetratricopeptide repeat protein [Armatimonadota bacterium]MDR7460709.1 tetratricopeptide repeat protein [Armatimonadota bacterium]MDR7479700.1 tetratricopeptide repeat protein [Armatimonadota bacterium]MDR7487837.1 tetratricopeptide repeat protein [Armatimonadota bacterium]MDR7501715.1 tetratricopeptide repeat protein [Armatimonadota bacterium]
MSRPPDRIELPDPDEVREPFARFLAIFIVVTTFLGALVGFQESYAEMRADRAAVEAQDLGVRAVGELLRAQDLANVHLETYALVDEQRAREANARLQMVAQDVTTPGQPRDTFLRTMARSRALAARTAELTDIRLTGPEGPLRDAAFPHRFFVQRLARRHELLALQDAANEEDAAWRRQANTYAAALTAFAVAVYLAGLSLTLRTGVTRLLAGVAVGLVAVGTVLAGLAAAAPPRRAPAAAARAYAEGMVGHALATTPAAYLEARAHFDEAIRLRPTFARAYLDRARASFRSGSPQTMGMLSVTGPNELRASTADLLRAYDLGLRSTPVMHNLGFEFFLQALLPGADRAALLARSVRFAQEALRLAPDDPILHYNLGVALLAAGRTGAAEAAYTSAVEATRVLRVQGPDGPREEPRGSGYRRSAVAGALTDLEILLRARPDLGVEVRRMKEFIVRSVWPPDAAARGAEVRVADLRVHLFPATLQWIGRLEGYDPDRDTLFVQWYHLDPGGRGWSGLHRVSGAVRPRVNRRGEYFWEVHYLPATSPPRCLPAGRYRVELYGNGRLAGTAEAAAEDATFEGAALPDLNLALCRPVGWERWRRSTFGFAGGYVSPEGTRGALLFRYHPPLALAAGAGQPQVTAAHVAATLRILTAAGVFPAQPAFVRPSRTSYFLGIGAVTKGWYAYGPGSERGQVYVGAGLHPEDGAVLVGLVFGPEDYFRTPEPLRIFESFIVLESYR